jgi:hypothetical protein
MKHVLFFSLTFFLLLGKTNAQTKAKASVTFDVCDLQPVKNHFPLVPYKSSVDEMCGSGVEAWSKNVDSLVHGDMNPLVACVRDAYLNHRTLILSPDMIWLMISQGFAIHVDQNSDSLRHYFVDFTGKKVLSVERDEFLKGSPDNDWQGVFPEFTKQIGDYTGQELLNTTLVNYSTTGPAEKAAFEVTLMDAMSSYFIYRVVTITCGIPKITLEGTSQDWETLRTKALALKKYDLGWWIDSLKPVLDQFVDASKGKVDKDFWAKIYNYKTTVSGGGCGGPTTRTDISGWITKFFPYSKYGDNYYKRKNISETMEPEYFPSGLSKADFYWLYIVPPINALYQMEFIAGFTGYTVNKSGALRPEIGWAIRDTGKEGVKDEDKKYEKEITTPPKGK